MSGSILSNRLLGRSRQLTGDDTMANRGFSDLGVPLIYGILGVLFFAIIPWSLWPSKLGLSGYLLTVALFGARSAICGDRANASDRVLMLGCLAFAVREAVLAVISVAQMLGAV